MRAVRRIASVVVLVVTGWFLYRFSYLRYACHQTEIRVQQVTTEVLSGRSSAFSRIQAARQNAAQIRQCTKSFPWIVNLHMIEAANLRILGRDREAIAAYEAALRYDRRPELYHNLGAVQAAVGDPAATRNLTIAGVTSALATAGNVPNHLLNDVYAVMYPLHQSIRDATISDEELRALVETLASPHPEGPTGQERR
jgi:hypothetical protein